VRRLHITRLAIALVAAFALSALAPGAVALANAQQCGTSAQLSCDRTSAFDGFARAAGAKPSSAQERAARAQLILAGHIPPPGRMTRTEVNVFLKAYKREHPYWYPSAGQYLQIAGRLEAGRIVVVKPEDMQEPEWIRRSKLALDVLSFIPVARMASVSKSLASRLARVAAGGLPELRAEAQEAVVRAAAMIGPGRGAVYGTRVHHALKLQILGSPNLRGEVSFLKGQSVRSGTPGSIRLDIVAYSEGRPAAIFDLKTGGARLTAARIRQIQRHIPASMRNVPIEELRIG